MLGVTADSNIYISALEFAGLPRQFLESARAGAFRLAISPPLLEEVRGVLREKFHWSEALLDEETGRLAMFVTVVHPSLRLDVVVADPDDDRVLECAVEAGSRYIVTGDHALLRLGAYQGIHIVKVADFLKLMPWPAP